MRNLAPRQRGGFTLVELLVVIGIIAALAALLAFSIGPILGTARENATRGTIKKIQGMVEERVRAYDIAEGQNRFKNEILFKQRELINLGFSAAQAQRLAPIIFRKEKLKQLFPQSLSGGSNNEAESSEALYAALTEGTVLGVPPVGTDQFTDSEVTDTDGDGRLEFVDAWGNPLRFYLWPTRLVRPDADQDGTADSVNPGGVTSLLITSVDNATFNQDPDDPAGDIFRGLSASSSSAAEFEQNYHTLDTYHLPLIVSAGADRQLGLSEPTDRDNFGYLAQPLPETLPPNSPGESALTDNITNHQRSGGN